MLWLVLVVVLVVAGALVVGVVRTAQPPERPLLTAVTELPLGALGRPELTEYHTQDYTYPLHCLCGRTIQEDEKVWVIPLGDTEPGTIMVVCLLCHGSIVTSLTERALHRG